ncbi:hypothetical protein GNT69_02770 [Bacillus sp. B15-48]|nr:hypothetical protein [Bacillus sp. B15-48]
MSFGLALNVKSYLGVAPILTMPLSVSEMMNWNFAFTLFLFYILFILLQVPLKGKNFKVFDFMQFPISLVISKLLDIFTGWIWITEEDSILIRLIVLGLAIVLTGIGVAMSVAMKKAPNPADGLAQAIGERFRFGLGTGKNILDLLSIGIAFIISMVYFHYPIGIGIGTVAAGLLVGRVIAVFNRMCKKRLDDMTGISDSRTTISH